MSDANVPMPPEQPTGQPHVPPLPPTPPSGSALPPPAAFPGVDAPPGPTTSPKRTNVWAWAVGGTALVVALGVGAVIGAISGDDTKPTAHAVPSSSVSSPRGAPTTVPASTAPAVTTYVPTKSDFKLKVKILSKQCFGSAGCNITYRIGVTYTGAELDPYKTYEVTYEVKGAEDPIVNTLEVTGDSASVQQEEMARTRRSSDKLTAVVTDVSEL